MTEFEKKLKIRHEKRMKYKADPEKLRMRLERDKMLMDKEYDKSIVKRGMAAFFSHIVSGNRRV